MEPKDFLFDDNEKIQINLHCRISIRITKILQEKYRINRLP